MKGLTFDLSRFDGEDFEDEGPQDIDLEELGGDEEQSETVPCPACGAEVYEDAERCPSCGRYVVPTAGALPRNILWWLVFGVAAAAVALYLTRC